MPFKPHPNRDLAPQAFKVAARAVAKELGLSVKSIQRPRGRQQREARHYAAYLAVTVFGVPVVHVAQVVRASRRGLGYGVARCEDRRDDAAIDKLLMRLEEGLSDAQLV